MILILTAPHDPHADHLIPMLEERGADYLRFNPADFPSKASLSVGFDAGSTMRSFLRVEDRVVDLTRLSAVWNRRPKSPRPAEHIQDEAVRDYIVEDCKTFLTDLYNVLPRCWLPGPPAAIRRADLKASQLRLATELGFDVPPTLITNSREELLEFYNAHNGSIISKLVSSAFYKTIAAEDAISRYTEVVTKRDIGYAASLSYSPMIFQAYVAKQLELRVTVVGQQVFAAEIHSQQTHHTQHDWRRYDLTNTPHHPHELPADVERLCVRLVEQLDLSYGAIDLILTPEGRYVFLEINPSGQYLWIEQETGLPISSALCDFLTAGEGAIS